MTDNDAMAQKAVRRKRRVTGTDTPPRKEFPVRLELWLFERMNQMLLNQKFSRNAYIAELIAHDLAYRDRIAGLNTKVATPKDPAS